MSATTNARTTAIVLAANEFIPPFYNRTKKPRHSGVTISSRQLGGNVSKDGSCQQPDNRDSAASHDESVVRLDASVPVAGDERLLDTPAASGYNAGMKYSLRSLMILVTLAAIGMGWWNHCRFCLRHADECDKRCSKFFLEAMNLGEYCGTPREDEEQRKIDDAVSEYGRLQKREHKRSQEYRLAVWRPWLRWTLDAVRENQASPERSP